MIKHVLGRCFEAFFLLERIDLAWFIHTLASSHFWPTGSIWKCSWLCSRMPYVAMKKGSSLMKRNVCKCFTNKICFLVQCVLFYLVLFFNLWSKGFEVRYIHDSNSSEVTLHIKLFNFRKVSPKLYKPLFPNLLSEDKNTASNIYKYTMQYCIRSVYPVVSTL